LDATSKNVKWLQCRSIYCAVRKVSAAPDLGGPKALHPVAILELKKWGALRGQGKCRGANINVYLARLFFIVLKIKLP